MKSINTWVKVLRKKKLKILIPGLYALGLIAGFFLSIAQALFLPKLTHCFMLSGAKFCAPLGVIITLVANLPGYLLVGRVEETVELSNNVSIVTVMLTSLGIYYLIGMYLDKIKKEGLTPSVIAKYIIIASLFVLGFLLFILT